MQNVPEGRVEITGEIINTRWYDGDYGEVLQCTIRDDRGFKVYGSVPTVIVDYASSEDLELKGQRIRLTGTVKPSYNDPQFGYYKRPAKSQLIQ
tara:strand:- start:139 stop:420 length:282 start_codon:yes stop_codon:yes gene_type:complete